MNGERQLEYLLGLQVTWMWMGGAPHDVASTPDGTCNDLMVLSDPASPSGSFQRTFTDKGTFHYACTIHCQSGMVITVNVA